MRKFAFLILLVLLLAAAPSYASEQITYISQPEQVMIFLNDIAFVRDTLTLPANSDVQIILPDQIYQDTLILRENGERVPIYSISRASGPLLLKVPTPGGDSARQITLEYLVYGLSWQPNYDMQILEGDTAVQFAFFAEIQNSAFSLEDVDVTLVAGRVDTSQQLRGAPAVTANQYIAGYDTETGGTLSTGAVTIQHTYPLGKLNSAPGDTLYSKILDKSLPARRILLWNAQIDPQVTVIYKVRDDSDVPLAEGIVRSYQDGLFTGSDFIEFTPVGSEGSVTVGSLQDVRVKRSETQSYLENARSEIDTLHEITLTLSNFSDSPVQIDVVDNWPPEAQDFTFSEEPQRDADNLFRWTVTIPAGETVTINYTYKAPY